MKTLFLFALLAITISLVGCKSRQADPQPVDNVKLGQELLNRKAKQLWGKWLIQDAAIAWKPYNPYFTELGISRDTVLHNLATLTIPEVTPVITNLSPQSYNYTFETELAGTLSYGSESYPVYLSLMTYVDFPNTDTNLDSHVVWIRLQNYKRTAPGLFTTDETNYFRKLGFFHTMFQRQASSTDTIVKWLGTGSVSALGLNEVTLVKQ